VAIGLARHACYQTRPLRLKNALSATPLGRPSPLLFRSQRRTHRWALWLLPPRMLLIGLLPVSNHPLRAVAVGRALYACYQTQPLRRKSALYATLLGDIMSFNYLLCYFFTFHEHCCCAHFLVFTIIIVAITVLFITSTCTFTAEVVAYQSNGKGREAVYLDLSQKQRLVQKGTYFAKSKRLAMDRPLESSNGDDSLRFSLLFLAWTPGPVESLSTFPSTSSKGRDAANCLEHFGNLDGWVG